MIAIQSEANHPRPSLNVQEPSGPALKMRASPMKKIILVSNATRVALHTLGNAKMLRLVVFYRRQGQYQSEYTIDRAKQDCGKRVRSRRVGHLHPQHMLDWLCSYLVAS